MHPRIKNYFWITSKKLLSDNPQTGQTDTMCPGCKKESMRNSWKVAKGLVLTVMVFNFVAQQNLKHYKPHWKLMLVLAG